jgi:mRNA-degrading endonuclease RelE of RelBE toxin-antitoxin system
MSVFANRQHELIAWPAALGGLTNCHMKPSASLGYALHISSEIEARLALCRTSIRTAIRDRLQDITDAAGSSPSRPKQAGQRQPPLRSYAHEGYRVFYQVDRETRRVVVLDLGGAPSAV